MLGLIRMAGLGLCLGAGFLYQNASATSGVAAREPSAKAFPGRLAEGGTTGAGSVQDESRSGVGGAGKGDRLRAAACADQTWPYIAADCLGEGAARRPVRTVTVSDPTALGATLTRIPAVVVANR